nr:MAG TPA: hypothetical protein [Caudoviricetes sp.]
MGQFFLVFHALFQFFRAKVAQDIGAVRQDIDFFRIAHGLCPPFTWLWRQTPPDGV